MALRDGARADVDYVVMDEFHYYADKRARRRLADPAARAAADARFLLMSRDARRHAPSSRSAARR